MSTEDEELEEHTEEGPRSFAHQIATMCNGETNIEASQELHDLLLALRAEALARRKKVKGEFKLVFAIEVNDDDVVTISPSIKSKAPEPRRSGSIWWLTPGGNLTPENPRQAVLPGIREVPRPAVREVDINTNSETKGV